MRTWAPGDPQAALENFFTLGLLRCAACHKSYCCCKSSHIPGSVPNASESRSAIAAVNDARPFNSRERVDRATRSRLAASPTCTAPRYSRRISPGCAGLYIVIAIRVLLSGYVSDRLSLYHLRAPSFRLFPGERVGKREPHRTKSHGQRPSGNPDNPQESHSHSQM